jgi:hypothetical protein
LSFKARAGGEDFGTPDEGGSRMFCPRCAAHNTDDARYCRVCGADISLLPQVLSGELTAALSVTDESAVEEKGKRRRSRKGKTKEKQPPTLEKAFENIGVGLAFLIISIMIAFFMPGGAYWWFWMLIPAGACAGEGIGQFLRIQREKTLGGARPPLMPIAREAPLKNLPPRDTSEMLQQPLSVTEGTTRHLSPELPPRNLDEQSKRSESMLDSNLK